MRRSCAPSARGRAASPELASRFTDARAAGGAASANLDAGGTLRDCSYVAHSGLKHSGRREMVMSQNSFGAKGALEVEGRKYEIFRLAALQPRFDIARLPFSLKVLLENLLRTEGDGSVAAADIEALAGWDAKAQPSKEIAFSPARVLMQDFTGVPAVVDLAAMRDA